MAESGTRIDYSLRSRKYVERKIFSELFQAINTDTKTISDYRYIGLGSFYFSDFVMMHELFGIKECICFTKNNNWYYNAEEITALILNEVYSICNNMDIEKCESSSNCGIKMKKCSEWSKIRSSDKKSIIERIEKFISDCTEKYGQLNLDDDFYEKINNLIREKITNRYEFNKPFTCIDIKYGDINNCYKKLPQNEKSNDIIWLDYDEFLNPDGIELIKTISKNSKAGDILIITVGLFDNPDEFVETYNEALCSDERCSSDEDSEEYCDDTKPFFIERIDHKDVFQKSDIPKTLYKLINSIINGEIEKRITNSINMYEVLSCTYKDGRYMYTYAVVFDNKDSKIVSRIKDREWYIKRNTDSIYDIDVPCMTNLERRRVSQHLPQADVEALASEFPFIPKADIEKYIPIYRYYPNFISAENKA